MLTVVLTNLRSGNPSYPESAEDVILGPFESIELPSVTWDRPLVGRLGEARTQHNITRTHDG